VCPTSDFLGVKIRHSVTQNFFCQALIFSVLEKTKKERVRNWTKAFFGEKNAGHILTLKVPFCHI
jgi:hypothetical protein